MERQKRIEGILEAISGQSQCEGKIYTEVVFKGAKEATRIYGVISRDNVGHRFTGAQTLDDKGKVLEQNIMDANTNIDYLLLRQ